MKIINAKGQFHFSNTFYSGALFGILGLELIEPGQSSEVINMAIIVHEELISGIFRGV